MQATLRLREKKKERKKTTTKNPPKTSVPTPCTPSGATNVRRTIGSLNKPALIINLDLLVKHPACNVNILQLVYCTQQSQLHSSFSPPQLLRAEGNTTEETAEKLN